MSSLFRSTFSTKRENIIKEAIINTLNENLREVQYEATECGKDCLELCESTSSLCTTLEAIFLHGLKDSFLWQTINVIAGDVERRPEPSFWSPMMVFLHKQVIEQIQSLPQITSEIGQCRAWIRLSLNESLFSSYLKNIRRNSSALNPYYKKCALLKDACSMDVTVNIMERIEATTQFDLPVNSSLLNQWPDYALQLSGLWTPPLKSCPISSGVDIAGSIAADTVAIPTPQPLRTNELFSESISNSPFSRASNFGVEDLSQRENLELFLQKVDEMDIINEEDISEAKENVPAAGNSALSEKKQRLRKKRQQLKLNLGAKSKERTNSQSEDEDVVVATTSDLTQSASGAPHGNSLTNLMQSSWSSELNTDGASDLPTNRSHTPTPSDDGQQQQAHFQRSTSMTSSTTSSLRSPGYVERCSYNALLRKHERSRNVDWTEVWEKFLLQNVPAGLGNNLGQLSNDGDDAVTGELDQARHSICSQTSSEFEIVSQSALERFDIAELQEMVEQLCHLAREPGLDAQGFLCLSCQHPLGIGYSNFQVCAFSGNYFCDSCMDIEPVLIPARIIYNWDFRKYYISKRAAAFLAEFRNQPFIDLKLLNPDIYQASDAMAELQSLRIRLNFLRAYLYTCSPTAIEELQRQFFGKEYLYEHIHQYSIGDLGMIQRGTLNQQLQKAYKFGEGHVLKCMLCSLKGFICEICKSPRVLYPFHIDTTYRCEICGAVFHANCLNENQPCPKCERRRKREEVLVLEST